jgi:hypothetical protein
MRLAAAFLLTCAIARAEPVVEPATGQSFEATRTVDGRPFALLGTGVRKKIGFKVYAMALYVDETDGRRAFPALAMRAGGRDRSRLINGDHAQSFVIWGQFAKLGVMRFVRNVGGEKIRDGFKEGLEDELAGKGGPELQKAAEAFVALFGDRELKVADEIHLLTGGDGKVQVEIAGERKDGPQSPKLVRAVWNIWLGAKPISTDLRKGLIERVDVLGRAP